MDTTRGPFSGSKVALFVGSRLLVTLRDDDPDILCPNMWDLVGGGADGDETPWQVLKREVMEEVGLDMDRAEVVWQRSYPGVHTEGWVVFYVARMPAEAERDIVLGDEGQRWDLIAPRRFLTMPDAVPSLPPRLAEWHAETGGFDCI